jgi:hypothetical protein
MAVDPPNIIGRGDRQEYQCARRARSEKTREAARKRRAADPEGYREYGRKWRAANPQKVREYQRRWRAANKNKRATREERLTKRAAARLRKDRINKRRAAAQQRAALAGSELNGAGLAGL